MNYPKSITIGGATYKIKYKKLEDSYGLCDTVKQIIFLDSENNPERMLLTFMHEVLHMILTEGNLKIILESKKLDQELFSHAMAPGLAEVVKSIIKENS